MAELADMNPNPVLDILLFSAPTEFCNGETGFFTRPGRPEGDTDLGRRLYVVCAGGFTTVGNLGLWMGAGVTTLRRYAMLGLDDILGVCSGVVLEPVCLDDVCTILTMGLLALDFCTCTGCPG
jgi:hypothetical protein